MRASPPGLKCRIDVLVYGRIGIIVRFSFHRTSRLNSEMIPRNIVTFSLCFGGSHLASWAGMMNNLLHFIGSIAKTIWKNTLFGYVRAQLCDIFYSIESDKIISISIGIKVLIKSGRLHINESIVDFIQPLFNSTSMAALLSWMSSEV